MWASCRMDCCLPISQSVYRAQCRVSAFGDSDISGLLLGQRDYLTDADLSRHIFWVLIQVQESKQLANNMSPHMSSPAKAGIMLGASERSFLLSVDCVQKLDSPTIPDVLAWDGGQQSQVLETWARRSRRLGLMMKEFKEIFSYVALTRYPA